MNASELVAHYAAVRSRLMGKPPAVAATAAPQNDEPHPPVDLSARIRTGRIAPMEIVHRVARGYGITAAELRGPSRNRREIRARHCAAYWLDRRCGLSLKQIAHFIGRSDHTTVLNAIKKHKIRRIKRRDNATR